MLDNFVKTYSQNREDIIIDTILKHPKNGFYIDVGASHPSHLSVTKLFYEKGWSGVNIEPSERMISLLNLDRKRDTNLHMGVSNKESKLTLREYKTGDGFSTFADELKKQYEKESLKVTREYNDVEVPVYPLRNILDKLEIPTINFMKIDVEGFEYEVLEGNNWTKYRPQVICIEANHILREWHELLKKNKYNLVFFDGINEYYVANECKELADDFKYEDVIYKPTVSSDVVLYVNTLNTQIQQSGSDLVRQELINQALTEHIHELNAEAVRRKRLRSLVKQLMQAINQIILVHIEGLNKPKVNKISELDLSGTENDPELIINRLEVYDFETYYKLKKRIPLLYRIVRGTYLTFARFAREFLIDCYKLLRKGVSNAKN